MSETLGRLLATGNVAEIFEFGGRVVKLYKSAAAKAAVFREAALHAGVEAMGLPVPLVWGVQQFGDRWGIVLDRVEHASFAAKMRESPDALGRHLDAMVRLHVRLHTHQAIAFPGLKARLAANIGALPRFDERRRETLLTGLAAMPEGDRLCHGDFHPLNILGEIADPVMIDWGDARRGDPAADACRSYLLLRLHAADLAAPYLAAYCAAADIGQARVLAWLRYVAAAKLAENVASEVDGLRAIVD